MTDFKIRVDNGKYTFVMPYGWQLNVLRHGEPWIENLTASKAIHSMMADLDAARVVVAAVRRLVGPDREHICGADAFDQLVEAIRLHDGLTGSIEPPSEWADACGKYQDAGRRT